jgi:hypothetical protein
MVAFLWISLSLMGAHTNPWFEFFFWNYWHALCYKVENSDRLCHLSIVVWKWIRPTQVEGLNITNLTSHDLVMEIVQNSFNRNSYISHTNIVHWKHIWNTNLLEDVKFVGHLFIHRFVLHCRHIYLCVKCVFNAWHSCIKCMNLWMNELHIVFIINSSHVKFVMNHLRWNKNTL